MHYFVYQKLKFCADQNETSSGDYIFISLLPNTIFLVSPEEKEVIDAINKQNDEVKREQERVKNLVDRIAAEIERTSCEADDTGRPTT